MILSQATQPALQIIHDSTPWRDLLLHVLGSIAASLAVIAGAVKMFALPWLIRHADDYKAFREKVVTAENTANAAKAGVATNAADIGKIQTNMQPPPVVVVAPAPEVTASTPEILTANPPPSIADTSPRRKCPKCGESYDYVHDCVTSTSDLPPVPESPPPFRFPETRNPNTTYLVIKNLKRMPAKKRRIRVKRKARKAK